MSDTETYLVIGYTNSARNLIEQLRKLSDSRIVWAGEGKQPERVEGIEFDDLNNPSWPGNVKELTEKHQPKMVFLSPGAEHDLVDLTEGENLERSLHREDILLDGVPTIVISDEHHN